MNIDEKAFDRAVRTLPWYIKTSDLRIAMHLRKALRIYDESVKDHSEQALGMVVEGA